MQIIFDLLRKAENIKLAPELLDPEPPRNFNDPKYEFVYHLRILHA
jgi:hypothetical protein